MPGPGKPTKLTPERQAKIVELIAQGNYLEIASRCAGIDYATFRTWMIRGERETKGLYRDFRDAVVLAEAAAEAKLVAQWEAAGEKDWKATKELLERRHPERWRLKQALELTGAGGGPVQTIDLTKLPDDAITQLETILGQASTDVAGSTGGTSPPSSP